MQQYTVAFFWTFVEVLSSSQLTQETFVPFRNHSILVDANSPLLYTVIELIMFL